MQGRNITIPDDITLREYEKLFIIINSFNTVSLRLKSKYPQFSDQNLCHSIFSQTILKEIKEDPGQLDEKITKEELIIFNHVEKEALAKFDTALSKLIDEIEEYRSQKKGIKEGLLKYVKESFCKKLKENKKEEPPHPLMVNGAIAFIFSFLLVFVLSLLGGPIVAGAFFLIGLCGLGICAGVFASHQDFLERHKKDFTILFSISAGFLIAGGIIFGLGIGGPLLASILITIGGKFGLSGGVTALIGGALGGGSLFGWIYSGLGEFFHLREQAKNNLRTSRANSITSALEHENNHTTPTPSTTSTLVSVLGNSAIPIDSTKSNSPSSNSNLVPSDIHNSSVADMRMFPKSSEKSICNKFMELISSCTP